LNDIVHDVFKGGHAEEEANKLGFSPRQIDGLNKESIDFTVRSFSSASKRKSNRSLIPVAAES
jgi:hypothetical protein